MTHEIDNHKSNQSPQIPRNKSIKRCDTKYY